MKATGIVRRIDDAIIIKAKQENPIKSRSFACFVPLF